MAKWGQGTIYRRGKTYWIKYYANGKAYYESAKSDKHADAARLLAERMNDVGQGKPTGIRYDKVMLSELIEDLKADYIKQGNRTTPPTKHIEEFFAGYRVVDVTSSEITKFINSRLEAGAAKSSINSYLSALTRMFNIGRNATPPKVDRPPKIEKFKDLDNVKQVFFEDEEFWAIRELLPEHVKGLVEFAYWTGWRLGQIRKLEWKMVNMKERLIYAPGTIAKKPHVIYMADPLFEVIKERNSKRNLGCPYVFHKEGKQVKNFRRSWNTACREISLGYGYKLTKKYNETWERRNLEPGPTIHDFRRTAARNLIRAGVSRSVAKKITGHKTDAMFERYNITDARDIQEAAELQAAANSYKNSYNQPESIKKESNLSG